MKVMEALGVADPEIDVVSKGIDRYMETAVLADDTDRHKPDPTPLLMCLERLGIEPAEAIYIGDARSDYEAARNAHMAFGYATWGSTSSEGIEEPDVVLDAPKDILQAVL